MRAALALGLSLTLLGVLPDEAAAQDVRIRDLTLQESAVPIRLMGYGLVVGLDGTGDKATSSGGSVMTVRSVANLLRRFDVEVPEEILGTKNVAAVLVTAEVSPYLRAGGRFEVHVSSMGDARSLRGGVLWVTPLVADADGDAVATAQGSLIIADGGAGRGSYTIETTARMPTGGIIEGELPRTTFATSSRLLLREPDLAMATRLVAAINSGVGPNTASIEDPGSLALSLPDDVAARSALLSEIGELRVTPSRVNRVVIDSRDGTVVAGGDLEVGDAVISHGAVTLTIGGNVAAGGGDVPGSVRVPGGTSAQAIAAALHAFQTPPVEIAAIFSSLREVGAISAEVVVR